MSLTCTGTNTPSDASKPSSPLSAETSSAGADQGDATTTRSVDHVVAQGEDLHRDTCTTQHFHEHNLGRDQLGAVSNSRSVSKESTEDQEVMVQTMGSAHDMATDVVVIYPSSNLQTANIDKFDQVPSASTTTTPPPSYCSTSLSTSESI